MGGNTSHDRRARYGIVFRWLYRKTVTSSMVTNYGYKLNTNSMTRTPRSTGSHICRVNVHNSLLFFSARLSAREKRSLFHKANTSARPIRKSGRGATAPGSGGAASQGKGHTQGDSGITGGHTLTQDCRDRLTGQPQNSLRHFLRTLGKSVHSWAESSPNHLLGARLANLTFPFGGCVLTVSLSACLDLPAATRAFF